MPILYSNISKAVALRANQLADAPDAAGFNAQFESDLKGNLGGLEVPYAALKLAILASEKSLAELIAFSGHQTYRRALSGTSKPVADAELIPAKDKNGKAFVGDFYGVYDEENNEALTREDYRMVMRVRRNPDFYTLDNYLYCLSGSRVYHTRYDLKVYFEGCVFDDAAQSALFDQPTGASPLPGSLEKLWIADVLGNLPQENWFVNESQIYRAIAADCLDRIKANLDVKEIVLPKQEL